jgi:hypothetical protein
MSKKTSDRSRRRILLASCLVLVLCSTMLAPSLFSQSASTGALTGTEDFGFALESRHAFGVARKGLGQDFDGHVTPELGVAGTIDFAHPSRPNCRENFIRPYTSAGQDRHGLPLSWNPQSITVVDPFEGELTRYGRSTPV